jgi:hypothetical protein
LIRVSENIKHQQSYLYLINQQRILTCYKTVKPDRDRVLFAIPLQKKENFFLATLNIDRKVIILRVHGDFHYLFLKERNRTISVIPDYRPARNPYSAQELEILTGYLEKLDHDCDINRLVEKS